VTVDLPYLGGDGNATLTVTASSREEEAVEGGVR
jgi:hypothetical protein